VQAVATTRRKWICAYCNGRIGEITTLTTSGDCQVRVYEMGPDMRVGRQWALASFASAAAKADELAGESSQPQDWVEANRD